MQKPNFDTFAKDREMPGQAVTMDDVKAIVEQCQKESRPCRDACLQNQKDLHDPEKGVFTQLTLFGASLSRIEKLLWAVFVTALGTTGTVIGGIILFLVQKAAGG